MIPTQYQIKYGYYKLVDGVWHKRCTGPAHEEHEWLPANDKYFYFLKKTGRPVSRCRLCHNWGKLKSPGSYHGYIPVDIARPYYIEVVNRIGAMELSNRSGLSINHILRVLTNIDKKFVEKAKLRKVMLELVSIRRKNEHSITKSARWRQEKRNAGEIDLCPACGVPKNDVSLGCPSCQNRQAHRFKNGKITKKEYAMLKERMYFTEGKNTL